MVFYAKEDTVEKRANVDFFTKFLSPSAHIFLKICHAKVEIMENAALFILEENCVVMARIANKITALLSIQEKTYTTTH